MPAVPRFTGVRTFASLPQAAARVDAAVLGVPFDTATSYRTGARFGPEAIRSASVLLRPWHPGHGVDVFASQTVIDGGDIAITPGNAARTMDQIAAALEPVLAAGTVPLVLGGDHSIALGELRAHAAVHGPVGLLLLDAHADTWEDYYGERIFHGTPFRRAVEQGVLDPGRSLLAGIRGSLYAPGDLNGARELGFELLTIEQLRALGADGFAARAQARLGEGPAFLGFDIDVLDPSIAPATGTPEVGGLLAHEALALIRGLAGMSFTGFDVVEVCPPYDGPGQGTSLMAANVAYEMLALLAVAGGGVR